MPQLSPAVEVLGRVFPGEGKVPRARAKQLDHQRHVVFISRVVLPTVRVKEEIPRRKLEDHASKAPHIRRGVIIRANHDLGAPVLPRLNIVREVLFHPTGIAEIRNFEKGGNLLCGLGGGTRDERGGGGDVEAVQAEF